MPGHAEARRTLQPHALGTQRVCSKTALRQRPGPAPPRSPATHTATAAAHAAPARGGEQLTGGRKRRHSARRSCTLGSAAYSPTSAETAPPRPRPKSPRIQAAPMPKPKPKPKPHGARTRHPAAARA